MFYRRKSYVVKTAFVETFNKHFNETNLPNQLKNGTRFVGRWMKDNKDGTHEVFAIWEYDSYEDYVRIETNIQNDAEHVQRIQDWYDKFGGREQVRQFILEAKNEVLESTVD